MPALVDDLSRRSEFLTSYTQYQPEIAQGFLQVLFEYQSMLVELTGLDVANCSMYDDATALGEAATLSQRVRSVSGDRILVPDHLREGKRAVLSNYAEGPDLTVESYPMTDGVADVPALADEIGDDTAMVYAESPTVRGVIEERLGASVTSPTTMTRCSVSARIRSRCPAGAPASVGADVVVGDAASLGTGTAYGIGLGMFATREEYLRQVPGRLVGASEDAADRRAFTLTLQTREQHIRKERATSNICTNQAWVALRTAMHMAWLGPDRLVDLATQAVTDARDLAARLDDLSGVKAPLYDRHHFREFVVRTDQPAPAITHDLAAAASRSTRSTTTRCRSV